MAPRPKTMPKAVNPANQAALERLIEKRSNLGTSDRYSHTLKKAIDSLQSCATAITSHAEALKLKYVGTHCATLICPPEKERQQRKKRKNNQDAAASIGSSPASLGSTAALSTASVRSNTSAANNRKRQKVTSQQLARIAEKPTAKETKYQKAVQNALDWKAFGPLTWRVVLIIDARERQSDHVQAKCQMSGIPCEERHLPIGDMAWMAQGCSSANNNNNNNQVVVELMLGTIIERKTIEDLKASLFGTRYLEQRKRLQDCGLPQVLFLIEGDTSKDLFKCPADTLHTAVWETRLHLGFSIVHTAHLQDTVLQLKRMHRRILQRTFPRAFSSESEALPTFQEAHRSQPSAPRHNNSRSGTSSGSTTQADEAYRRRRRRLQSLNEMTFDIDPLPCFGMERFITYPELKAKIERDRERGTKTVGSIHLAMLKQVPGFSHKKCQAVARLYPTFAALMEAYESVDNVTTKQNLVTDVSTQEEGQQTSARALKVGPRGSAELFVAYQTDDPEGRSSDKNNGATKKNISDARIPRSVSRETSSPSSAKAPPPAAAASKPAARGLWKRDERMPAVPECIDLLSPVPPARPHGLYDNFSSPDDDDFATAADLPPSHDFSADSYQEPSNSKPPAVGPPTRQSTKKKKQSINTSFGSLLDDSSGDDGENEVEPPAKRSLNDLKPAAKSLPDPNEVIEID